MQFVIYFVYTMHNLYTFIIFHAVYYISYSNPFKLKSQSFSFYERHSVLFIIPAALSSFKNSIRSFWVKVDQRHSWYSMILYSGLGKKVSSICCLKISKYWKDDDFFPWTILFIFRLEVSLCWFGGLLQTVRGLSLTLAAGTEHFFLLW